MTSYETFSQLHFKPAPLLIGNVWDVVSAKTFEKHGFEAIATSSAALARTMGYDDGEQIPFDLLLLMVERIIRNVRIPLSVDMESGFSRNISGIIENIERLHALGAVGINIEDTAKDGSNKMMPVEDFQAIISAVANHLSTRNMHLFINARTDAFIHKLPSPVEETIKRAKAYEAAGANGIFVPFLQAEDDIKAIVQSTWLPVSVFSTPQLPHFGRLAQLGIKRISMGTAVHRATTISLGKMINNIHMEQSFKGLY